MARRTNEDDEPDDELEPDDDTLEDDEDFEDDEDGDGAEDVYATWDEWLDAYLDGYFDDDAYIEFAGGLDTGGGE